MTGHPKEIDAFASQVREFMAWCQSTHVDKSAEEMQREALQQLSRLYAAALVLPGVDYKPAPDPPDRSPDERERLAANLRPLPFQHYWEVFTPTDHEDHEPVCGDLFDDFLDIYADVAGGLWLYERKHYEAALFSWTMLFGVHWGRHVVSAMHALHSFEPPEEQA